MLSVVERMGLLDEVEVLSSQRDYVALDELHYLLNDNVEVITAPPQPEV